MSILLLSLSQEASNIFHLILNSFQWLFPQVRQMYQYFLEVVPSTTQRLRQENPFRSNQYSVTEQHRILQAMDRRIPGIYFKFDIEALGVHVREEVFSIPNM